MSRASSIHVSGSQEMPSLPFSISLLNSLAIVKSIPEVLIVRIIGLMTYRENKMFVLDPEQAPACQIVLPNEPTAIEERAAHILKQYLLRITGIELEVVGRSTICWRKIRAMPSGIDCTTTSRTGACGSIPLRRVLLAGRRR